MYSRHSPNDVDFIDATPPVSLIENHQVLNIDNGTSLCESGNLPQQAVYLYSPVLLALRQIESFYESGIFDFEATPIMLGMNPLLRLQMLATKTPATLSIKKVGRRQISALPIAKGGVVFYPFNSQSNMNAVTNRTVRHILTLHGESNKLASNRTSARLYDYISVAGPLARDRYLDAGVFTNTEVDNGRLVMMGDSFVQELKWITAADKTGMGALFYCPTWEGYGNGADNYSSVANLRGFHIVSKAAKAKEFSEIIVKPHPYLGLLQRSYLRDFVSGIKLLLKDGHRVRLSLGDANLALHLLGRTILRKVPVLDENNMSPVEVSLGICDVSGMEAVFLKQEIAHMVITEECRIPTQLQNIYTQKSLLSCTDLGRSILSYLDESEAIDSAHRQLVFGWQNPTVEKMSNANRRNWLINYVKSDPFWNGSGLETSEC